MNVADVLEAAAAVIVERGWCQRRQVDRDGRVCADGAIRVAALGDPLGYDDSRRLAGNAYDALTRFVSSQGIYWNDRPSRTADEVITALRDCAAAERAKP